MTPARGATEAATPILLAFEGSRPPERVLGAIRDGSAAGVGLYRGLNVESPTQLRELGDVVQAAAAEGGHPSAIVAIDQEGGQLMGIGPPATQFAGNMAVAAAGSEELARRVGRAIGIELAAVGCTVDWAPVLDLATTPDSPAVGPRSYGDDPDVVAAMGAAMVEGLQSAGVAAAAKHFPGAGETTADPHHGLPVVGTDEGTLREREVVPFRGAIAAGVRMVMISHGAYPALERDGASSRPALRSRAILRDLLRTDLGFAGVVVTDALDMEAVDQSDVPTAAIEAVESGVDLLLAGFAHASRTDEMARIVTGLSASAFAREAAERVAELRRWSAAAQPDLSVVGSTEHADLASELARRSLTLVRDERGLLPLRPGAGARVLVVNPRPADLTPADTSSLVSIRLADAVRRRHPDTTSLEVPIDPAAHEVAAVVERAAAVDIVVVGTIDAFRHPGQMTLAWALAGAAQRVVLVALRMPIDADAVPEIGTALCAYSIHDASTEAVAACLFGEFAASGRVPLIEATRRRTSRSVST